MVAKRIPYMRLCPFMATLVLTLSLCGATFESMAPFLDDADAVRAGRQQDLGRAAMEGPLVAEVMSHQTWTLVYTAGTSGIRPRGGIRIAFRHVPRWSPPQMDDPKAEGYLTVQTTDDIPAATYIEFDGSGKRFFDRYHPWQNIVQVTVPRQGLAGGGQIRVTFGDGRDGSPGMRVQPFDETQFVFKVYVDPTGTDEYFPLADNPAIKIVAADPYRLGAVMPSHAIAGQPTWCIVRAEDRYGNPAPRYRGTVRFSSVNGSAHLPDAYTFTPDDKGVHRFEHIVFPSDGDAELAIRDGTFKCAANPVHVTDTRPERLLLWGDIHGHTLHSDGRGTVEQFYDFAENVAGLDFCAVTDHAFEIVDSMWEHSKAVTNAVNKPGRFVTFQAYEWSGQSNVGGDHNIYFLDNDPPLYRSRSYYNYGNLQMYHGPEPQVNHIEDLFSILTARLKNKDIFCIPHYGGRRGNPSWHSPKLQRMIEVFSEHRRSEDWMRTFLEKRYRLGIIASTDGHFGNPGYGYLKPSYDWSKQEIGMATVAVYAPRQTRESIFRALYDRHAYATSGDRIILDVRADGHLMGSEYKTATAPTLSIHAAGTASIVRVEIKKDCEIVHTVEPDKALVDIQWTDPAFKAEHECFYYARVLQSNQEEAISSPIWVN